MSHIGLRFIYFRGGLIGCMMCGRWLTLGNQLGPDQIYEEDLAVRIKARWVFSFTRS